MAGGKWEPVPLTSKLLTNAKEAVLTKASAGTAATMFYPRELVHAVADGAALTGTSGGDRCEPLLSGVPKVVIASGGATASGKVILYFEE